jgi:hypothetical protein
MRTALPIWRSAQDGISNGINLRLGNGSGNFTTESFIAAERGIDQPFSRPILAAMAISTWRSATIPTN